MKYQFIILTLSTIFICSFNLSLLAQSTIKFSDTNDSHLIGKQMLFLEDPSTTYKLSDIQTPDFQQKFQPVNKDVFNHSATRSTFWFKFQIQNVSGEDIWLDINNNMIAQITLYRPPFDSMSTTWTGGKYEQKAKPYPVNTFWLPINEAQDVRVQTYYLQIQSDATIMLPIYIGTKSALYQNKMRSDALAFVFLGVMGIMFLYNLFVYLSIRDTIYLFYLGYIVMVFFQSSFVNSHPFIYELGFDIIPTTWWYTHYFIWTTPTYVLVGVFCIKYLSLFKHSKILTWFLLIQMSSFVFVFPLFTLLGFARNDLGSIYNLSVIIYDLTCLFAGYYIYVKKRDRVARFYILSWTFLLISVVGFILTLYGKLPFNIFTRHSAYFGIISEVWLFSIALGDRINILRRENQLLIERQNEILTKKVQEKTYKLQQANEELVVSNEELKQTQEEIVTQRDVLEMNNQELEEYQHRISQSIQSAQLIQNAILLPEPFIAPHFSDFFLLYLPKDIVSGDFYWMCHSENQTVFIEADCTGHGVSGAFMTLIGHSLLNQIIKFEKIYNPAEVMQALHDRLRHLLRQDETRNREGMDLCMVVLKKIKNSWEVKFGGAGQKLYYSENQEINVCKGSSKRIGGQNRTRKQFETQNLNFTKGTILYLCSDGYIDQNDEYRKKFGSKRFVKLLQEIQNKPLSEQKIKLENTLQIHQKNTEQRDDITIIGIKL